MMKTTEPCRDEMNVVARGEEAVAVLPEAEPQPAGTTLSLKRLALRGAVWIVTGYGLSHVLRLANNLILTRLLFPEAFGLMALVTVVLVGVAMFSDIGIAPCIIQNKRGEERDFLNTAWTIQVIRGFLLWLACCGLARPLAAFYEQPQLVWMLPVSGLSAAFLGFGSTSLVLAKRRLALRRLTLLELGTQALAIVTMVVWALIHPTIWALVVGSLVAPAAKAALSHFVLPGERCRFRWETEAARSLFRFGRWIFLSTALTFLVLQGDRLVFGKLLPLSLLGVYNIAVMMAMVPTNLNAQLGASVVFPAYSNVARSGGQLAAVFQKSRSPMVMVGGLLSASLIAAAPWLIETLYDERYVEAGWMLQILAMGIVFQLLECANGCALLAVGKPAAVAAGHGAKLTGMMICIPIGWQLGGLQGALVGLLVSEALRYLVSAMLIARIGLFVIGRDLLLIAAVAITSLFGYVCGRLFGGSNWGSSGATMTVAVCAASLWWMPAVLRALRQIVRAKTRESDSAVGA